MAKITNITSLPIAIDNACAIQLINYSSKIYIFGGMDENGDLNDVVYLYDIVYDTYTDTGFTLPVPLERLHGCVRNNEIYLFGGRDQYGIENHTIYKFDDVNGVVDTTKSITSDYVYSASYNSDTDQFFILNNTKIYDVVSGDLSSFTTVTDDRLKMFNIYDPKNSLWICVDSTTIYVYSDLNGFINNLSYTKIIPETYIRVEYIHNISPSEYLIVTSDAYENITFYRYNAFTNTLTKQKRLDTAYDDIIGFALCGNDFNVYVFGGTYDDAETLTKASLIDFAYYEVNYTYNILDVDVSPISVIPSQYDIYFMDQFDCRIIERNNGFDLIHSEVECFMGDSEVQAVGDGNDWIINIPNIRSDITVTITSYHYHPIEMNLTDGVTASSDNLEWVKGMPYIQTFTLDAEYTVKEVKIYNGTTDITETVYDEENMRLVLSGTDWNSYSNIRIFFITLSPTVRITLYKNTSLNNVVEKNIALIGEVLGNMRDNVSITNPSFLIDTSSIDVSLANYVYVENFQRYYYISSVDIVRTNLWRINLKVDVLMSYKDYILDLSCFISRSASDYNKKLPDAEDVLSPNPIIEIKEAVTDVFDQSATTNRFLLITNQ